MDNRLQDLQNLRNSEGLGPGAYTAAGTRALDRLAIEAEGIPGYSLMQAAATFTFEQILVSLKPQTGADWLIFCGAGNNAGDGYEIAALARQAGFQVKLVALRPVAELQADALTAARAWSQVGAVISWQEFMASEQPVADICVDAMLGTGLRRNLRGDFLAAVDWLNRQSAPVVAVDIPTGLSADTGCAMPQAVDATLTCTFIGRKRGLYTAAGRDACGVIYFSDLGVPASVYKHKQPLARLLTGQPVDLPPRRADSHKGSYGHVLICGGQPGMSGAALLAGQAALRGGAGLVSIATATEHATCLNLPQPELMVASVVDRAALEMFASRATVLVLGPGLGTGDWSRACFEALLGDSGQRPLVLDADALNLLAVEPMRRDNCLLTPHPAEAARLLDTTVAEVQANRFAAVEELASRYQAVVILKGSGSLVACPRTRVTEICAFGNPGMATAGMGDILSGLLGALLAQGLSSHDAARLGVVLHARAGDRLADREGQRGLLAGDMLSEIRSLINA